MERRHALEIHGDLVRVRGDWMLHVAAHEAQRPRDHRVGARPVLVDFHVVAHFDSSVRHMEMIIIIIYAAC